MDESKYIERFDQLLLTPEISPVRESVAFTAKAVKEFPSSQELWFLRGELLAAYATLSQTPDVQALCDEAFASYERAIDINPRFVEAYESLGYLFNAFTDLHEKAEYYFRKAVHLEGGPDAYTGLARVLAEQGNSEGALDVLSCKECPYSDDESAIAQD